MRIALLMSVCEGDKAIAREAASALIRGSAGAKFDVFILDDASPSRVGEMLAEHCGKLPGVLSTGVKLLPAPVGFRGGVTRVILQLQWIASVGTPYDIVMKIDPDSLVVREDFLDSFRHDIVRRGGRGLWSIAHPNRFRDVVLFLADLLPAGFRRKTVGTIIQRDWELSRMRPVWWSDIGWRALFHGYRFRYSHGAFYAFGGETFREIARRGYLDRLVIGRHGFVTSEEDPMATVLTRAVGDPLIDLNQLVPNWGIAFLGSQARAEEVLSSGTYLVHPIKDNDSGRKLRGEFMAALARRSSLANLALSNACHSHS
jgi:hypothetical protein